MGKNVRSDTPIVMGNVAPLHKTIVNLELQIQSQFRVIEGLQNELGLSRTLNTILRNKVKRFEENIRTLFWGPND